MEATSIFASMNRELKFRIWDTQNKSFIKDPTRYKSLAISCDGRGVYSGKYDDCVEDRYIIQQYTGLKDRNGKQIFEGDIVLSTCPKILNDNFSGEVIFDEGSFLVKINNTDIRGVSDELEIVGNIFENPELLK